MRIQNYWGVTCFALLPLKFIFTSFVKRFSKKLCIESSLFCDFSDWKHVRMIATCKKKTFSSRKFLTTMFCFFRKIRSQSNDFHHPFHTFAIKMKGNLALNRSSNLEICIFLGLIFYIEWKSVQLEHLTSIYYETRTERKFIWDPGALSLSKICNKTLYLL